MIGVEILGEWPATAAVADLLERADGVSRVRDLLWISGTAIGVVGRQLRLAGHALLTARSGPRRLNLHGQGRADSIPDMCSHAQ